MRTEFNNTYLQSVNQLLLLRPVAVSRVQDDRFRGHSNSEKLLVRAIEVILGQLFKSPPVIVRWSHWNSADPAFPIKMIDQVFEKCVAYARHPGPTQVIAIFLQNPSRVIYSHNPLVHYVLKLFNAG